MRCTTKCKVGLSQDGMLAVVCSVRQRTDVLTSAVITWALFNPLPPLIGFGTVLRRLTMMTLRQHFPDHVVAISASGQVDEQDDASVLTPALDAALERHQPLRLLYEFTPDFTGFSVGAMWGDGALGLRHWKSCERIAVVTDVPWVGDSANLFAFMTPGELQVFANHEQSDADRWVTA